MSGNDETEEKKLPPTEWKLRKAREKGQVAASTDFVRVSITVIGIAFIAFAWTRFLAAFVNGFDNVVAAIPGRFEEHGLRVIYHTVLAASTEMVPFLGILLVVAILANILHKRGIPISVHPIKPDFKRINPGQGLKKVFGMRNFVEFSLSFTRLALWMTIAAILLWFAMPTLLGSATCELPCVVSAGIDTATKFVIAAIIVLIIAALVDLPVQKALFLREMRMSHRELKRELRDTQGAPEFKGHRRDMHRDMSDPGRQGGVEDASVIVSGSGIAIALRFHQSDAPVPFVVAKGQGTHADMILQGAKKLQIPVEIDFELARALFETTLVGGFVPETHFQSVATVLVKAGRI